MLPDAQLIQLTLLAVKSAHRHGQFFVLQACSHALHGFLVTLCQRHLASFPAHIQLVFAGIRSQPDTTAGTVRHGRFRPLLDEVQFFYECLPGIIVDRLDDPWHHHADFLRPDCVIAGDVQHLVADTHHLDVTGDGIARDIHPVPERPVYVKLFFLFGAKSMDGFRDDGRRMLQSRRASCHAITSRRFPVSLDSTCRNAPVGSRPHPWL